MLFLSFSARLLLLVALLFVTVSVQATQHSCKKTLTVSVAAEWPPFSYLDNAGFKGLDIEIVELVLRKAQFCWNYVSYPSSTRSLVEFKKNNVDLIFAASYTEERASYAFYSNAYRVEHMQLFGSTAAGARTSLEAGSIVAINRGSYYGDDFEHFKAECEQCVVETNIASERLGLVKKRRADFAIEELLAGKYALHSENWIDFVKPTNITINSTPVYFMLNKHHFNEDELLHLNQAIESSHEQILSITQAYQERYGQ